MTNEQKEQAAAANAMIKAVYDEQMAEINGREYRFTSTVHKTRRKIYAFFSRAAPLLAVGDMSFLDWPEFDNIESMIGDMVLVNGMQISKQPKHWDECPEDYMTFISTAMSVISYPFFQGKSGG